MRVLESTDLNFEHVFKHIVVKFFKENLNRWIFRSDINCKIYHNFSNFVYLAMCSKNFCDNNRFGQNPEDVLTDSSAFPKLESVVHKSYTFVRISGRSFVSIWRGRPWPENVRKIRNAPRKPNSTDKGESDRGRLPAGPLFAAYTLFSAPVRVRFRASGVLLERVARGPALGTMDRRRRTEVVRKHARAGRKSVSPVTEWLPRSSSPGLTRCVRINNGRKKGVAVFLCIRTEPVVKNLRILRACVCRMY